MPITSLEFRNFRLYDQASFRPDPRLTIIVGQNASGKTSLLEAIHILSTGRSFRKAQFEQILRRGSMGLGISAQYQSTDEAPPVRLGFVQTRDAKGVRINDIEGIRQSEIAQILPVLVISPDSHFEFQQSARERRAALDWILFHVEPDFYGTWSRYQRVLVQRNAALKSGKFGRATFSWDEELGHLAESLQKGRAECRSQVARRFEAVCKHLMPLVPNVALQLNAGWDLTTGLQETLVNDRERDLARGHTHSGPHRADLRILVDSEPSQERSSHGQNKLLVMALRLAQIQYFYETTGRECCLLIDDLAAELDSESRARLVSYLAEMPVQVIITATEAENFDHRHWTSHKTFHVKQGAIFEATKPEIRTHFG